MEKLNALAARILDGAIELLPANQRSRFGEEWRSHFDELTNSNERFRHALECVLCALKTRAGLNGLPEPAGFRIEVPGFGAVESDLISGLRMMVFLAKANAERDFRFLGAARAGWAFFHKTMHLMNEKEGDRMDNFLARLQPVAGGNAKVEFCIEGIKYAETELPLVLEHYFLRELNRL
ncbi:MAG: hypothetical protein AB7O46_02980 [Xanthobacteraceae bacterium]